MERVLERHRDGVEDALPAPFDWRGLCSDAPEMVRRLGSDAEAPAGEVDEALVPELDLVEAAEQALLHAYLGGLAGIALHADDDRDPETVLEALLGPLEDEQEERFESLASDSLAGVERALAGERLAADEDSIEGAAALLTDAAWPSVEVALESLPPFDPQQDLALPAPVRQVLGGVARIGAILAAFRWLAGTPEEPG